MKVRLDVRVSRRGKSGRALSSHESVTGFRALCMFGVIALLPCVVIAQDLPETNAQAQPDGFMVLDEQTHQDLLAAEAALVEKLRAKERGGDTVAAALPEASAPAIPKEANAAPAESDYQAMLRREQELVRKLRDESAAFDQQPTQIEKAAVVAAPAAAPERPPVGRLQAQHTKLQQQAKSQAKSISTLKQNRTQLTKKLSQAEGKVQKLVQELEETRNRLMMAETEVERLSRILEKRNRSSLAAVSGSRSQRPEPRKRVARKAPEIQDDFGEQKVKDMPIATVTVNKANLRTGPGKNHSPIMTVERGTRLAVETRRGEWYRVIAPTGKRVWVSNQVVGFGKNAKASPSATVRVKGFDKSLEDDAFELVRSSSQ